MAHGDKPLLHFTSAEKLESILRSGELRPGPKEFGVYPIPGPLKEKHRSICFTEVSIEKAVRHADTHGHWGIALDRSWLVAQGVRAVKYLTEYETHEHRGRQDEYSGVLNHPFWDDTPFLSPTTQTYEFSWEREWRHVGVLKFSWDAVEFLISPEGRKSRIVPESDLGHFAKVIDWDAHTTVLGWQDGESEPFNRVMHAVVREILAGYENPLESLPYDREDPTGYNWMGLEQVDAYEIIEEKLPAAPVHVIEALAADLDEQAEYWVRTSEWETFHL